MANYDDFFDEQELREIGWYDMTEEQRKNYATYRGVYYPGKDELESDLGEVTSVETSSRRSHDPNVSVTMTTTHHKRPKEKRKISFSKFADFFVIVNIWKYANPFNKVLGTLLYIIFLPFRFVSLILAIICLLLPIIVLIGGIYVFSVAFLGDVLREAADGLSNINESFLSSHNIGLWWSNVKALFAENFDWPQDLIIFVVVEAICVYIAKFLAGLSSIICNVISAPFDTVSGWFARYYNWACRR